jgi:hypothetical protein
MKTVSFAILILLIAVINGMAQEIKPTTNEEYNYGVVGYKIQLQAKLGDKEGYTLKDVKGCEEDDRKIEFKMLFRNGEEKPCAVIMIYTRWRTPPAYYCISTRDASPDLWSKFHRSLTIGSDNPADQLQFFSTCLSRLMMDFAYLKP